MTTLIDELDAARADLLASFAGLDETALDRKGLVGEWSVKNVLAHIVGWEVWVIEMLQTRLAGGDLPDHLRAAAADEHAFNAAQVAEREELTPDEQLMELERTRDELLALLRGLDPARLDDPRPWPSARSSVADYLRASLIHHDQEHAAYLRAALDESH
ncbi:MAG TPA: DinB family protein [Roseiflexaceae bacterium]|nr:DinB family protein [Roseiflexaceae bacterium]